MATILTKTGQPAGLDNAWFDQHIFITLSGPSLKTLDLSKLSGRGIVTLGINNSPTLVKPTFWTYGDKTIKFHHAIWFDPSIIKLVTDKRLKDTIRIKNEEDGTFSTTDIAVKDLPGVFTYKRNAEFNPATFLDNERISCGNNKSAAAKNEWPHIINTMFTALQLPYALGFRTVYLLGCDFHMDIAEPYCFNQGKKVHDVRSNNASYMKMNQMIRCLEPHFLVKDYKVFNCNPNSYLRAFPYKPFPEAVRDATAALRITRQCDAASWYDC